MTSKTKAFLVGTCAALTAFLQRASAEDSAPGLNGVEAVASKVSSDYIRAKMPEGSLKPEFYSFGDGATGAANFATRQSTT